MLRLTRSIGATVVSGLMCGTVAELASAGQQRQALTLSMPGALVRPSALEFDAESRVTLAMGLFLSPRRSLGWLLWGVGADREVTGPIQVDRDSLTNLGALLSCAPVDQTLVACVLLDADNHVSLSRIDLRSGRQEILHTGPKTPFLELSRIVRVSRERFVGIGRKGLRPHLIAFELDRGVLWSRDLEQESGMVYDVQGLGDGGLLVSALVGDPREGLRDLWIGELSSAGEILKESILTVGADSLLAPVRGVRLPGSEDGLTAQGGKGWIRVPRFLLQTRGWTQTRSGGIAAMVTNGLDAAVIGFDELGRELWRHELGVSPFAMSALLSDRIGDEILLLIQETPRSLPNGEIEGGLRLMFLEP